MSFWTSVPKTGLEPARCETHAPETCASTNSATWALNLNLSWFNTKMIERKTGLGPATPTLARLCSTNWAISAYTTSRSEEEETRTPTTQLSLPPQSSASTNSATSPLPWNSIPNTEWHVVQNVRAENGTRTRDPNLGKVVLYQLSYFRLFPNFHRSVPLNASAKVLHFFEPTKFFSVFFIKNAHFSSF